MALAWPLQAGPRDPVGAEGQLVHNAHWREGHGLTSVSQKSGSLLPGRMTEGEKIDGLTRGKGAVRRNGRVEE